MRSTKESRVHCNSYLSDGREPFFGVIVFKVTPKKTRKNTAGSLFCRNQLSCLPFGLIKKSISTFNSDKPFTLSGNSLVLVIIPELDGW